MVAPIAGPFVRFPTNSFSDMYRRGFTQKKPYNTSLEYRMYDTYGRTVTDTYTAATGVTQHTEYKDATFAVNSLPDYAQKRSHAYNRAYENFKGSVQAGSAGWAENLAQVNKTRTMIIERSLQLATVVRALKKGRFGDVYDALWDPKDRPLRSRRPKPTRKKSVSQNFLEFEYGIKPVVNDLQESMKILTSDIPLGSLKGKATERFDIRKVVRNDSNLQNYLSSERVTAQVSCNVGARVTVSNPNVFLANQLGLIDLALPWKLVPFSFIVDWFVNVEQVLSSATDWYGVSLESTYNTLFTHGERTYRYRNQSRQLTNDPWDWSESVCEQKSVTMDRYLGIPSPSLVIKPFQGFSLERGAQAISLVLAVLGK